MDVFLVSNTLYLFVTFGPVLTLFLLKKTFKFKAKLIKRFKTVRKYEQTISIIFIVPFPIFIWFRYLSDTFIDFKSEVLMFPYFYLLLIPKELR